MFVAQTKSSKRQTAKAQMLTSFNPRTGQVMREIPATPVAEVAEAVATARKVQPEWASIPPRGRAHMLREVRHRIYDKLDDIVETVSSEVGKPRAEALISDALPTVLQLLYLERTAAKTLRDERPAPLAAPFLGMVSRVRWQPFGVVGAITPWNYPFFLSMMAVAPALFAGNTVVLKPSEVTPAVGECLREVFDPLPPGVLTVVQGAGDVGAALVDAPCDKIAFIGSPATGRRIAEAAARHLTPVVMELGGKDAAIVCRDADVDLASSGVLWGAFVNAGQTCAAVERIFVHEDVADEFTSSLLEKLERLRFAQSGDGDVGALTFKRQFDIVERHYKDAIEKGARVLGGGPDRGPQNENGSLWFAPTVMDGISDDMDMSREETFGPLVPIVRVRDEEEAIRRTNEEAFNLTATVWTRNTKKGEALAARLRCGAVGINEIGAAASGVPFAPWGGIGESGYGRLSGRQGLMEFVYPEHVTKKVTPGLKSLWWYPYDEATQATLRGATELLSAPGVKRKVDAARSIAANIGSALRGKF